MCTARMNLPLPELRMVFSVGPINLLIWDWELLRILKQKMGKIDKIVILDSGRHKPEWMSKFRVTLFAGRR